MAILPKQRNRPMANDVENRVSTLEATLQAFIAASDLRLNRVEEAIGSLQEITRSNAEAIGNLQEATRGNTAAIGSLQAVVGYLREITQSNSQTIQVLADLAQSNEVRFRQLAESQAGVLSRMDDVIAVMRERM